MAVRNIGYRFIRKLQRCYKACAKLIQEVKRTAKEGDFPSDRAAAGQTADCLIDDSLKNRSGHVLPPGPGIQKRHNVRLREHAAAGRNGIDRLRVGREFIEP